MSSEVERLREQLAELQLAHQRLRRVLAERTAETDDALGHLTSILDSMSDAVVVTDADGFIRLLNPAVSDFFGTSPMILGQPLSDHLPALAAVIDDLGDGGRASAEVPLASGRVGSAVANTIASANTERPGFVIAVRDITREVQLDRMKSALITNVSHELRTPLTSIVGFAKMARRRVDGLVARIPEPTKRDRRHMAQATENLDIVVSESERLTELIDGVIAFAALEAGTLELERSAVDLSGIVRAVADRLRHRVAPEVELVCALEPTPPIQADRARIEQVVVHLVDNATKFTATGEIRLTTCTTEQGVQLRVHDTGSGMEPEALAAAFHPFDQGGDLLTSKPTGTGLGLPTCRALVHRHGGEITAESTPSTGTTITVSLPR